MCLGIVSLERSNGPRRNTSDPVSGGQESLVPILAKGLVVLFAAAFLVRSSFMHAWQYWDAAKLNAAGLQLMETAETLQDEGRKLQYLDAARQSFEKAIESNPTFVTSYYKLANVYNSLGQIENYKLANAPKDPKYTDLAIAQYERLNELEPSYSEIHLNLGIMYMIKADQVVEEPAFLNGQADDLTKEAAKSKGQEKAALLEEAGRLREKAASLEKQAPEMRLQYLVKSKDALKEAARQSVKANVQWIAAQQAEQLAALLEKVGKSEQAVQLREDAKKFYSKIVTYKPKIDEAIKYKEFYYKRAQERLLKLARYAGNTEEERDVLKQCVAENPSDRGLINELMMVYDRLNRPKEKIEYLEQAVRDNPIDPYVRRVLAEAYLKSGDPDKYKQELKRLEILAPLDKTAISGLYLSYKDSDSTRTQIYKQKLAQIGVNADEVTTLITEQMSTATLGKPSAAAVQAALAKAKTAATSPSIVSTASLSPQ